MRDADRDELLSCIAALEREIEHGKKAHTVAFKVAVNFHDRIATLEEALREIALHPFISDHDENRVKDIAYKTLELGNS